MRFRHLLRRSNFQEKLKVVVEHAYETRRLATPNLETQPESRTSSTFDDAGPLIAPGIDGLIRSNYWAPFILLISAISSRVTFNRSRVRSRDSLPLVEEQLTF